MATTSWLIVAFDTAGEVIFTEASQFANQPVERAPSVDSGLFQTSPAVSLLVNAPGPHAIFRAGGVTGLRAITRFPNARHVCDNASAA
jgi:hypothetical protein